MISLKWKGIAEIVGLTAVLTGMYFVHAEVQQNGIIARLEIAGFVRDKLDEIRTRMLDPEFSILYLKGAHSPAELNVSERQMLNAHFESLFTVMGYEYNTHRLGIFVEWESIPRQIAPRYFVRGYGRAYWNVRKRTFYPEVVAFIEEELSKIDDIPQQDFDEEILMQIANP